MAIYYSLFHNFTICCKIANIHAPLKVAIMGCVVNGPGEAKEADVGIAGGKKEGLIFKKGKIIKKVKEDHLCQALLDEINRLTNT